MSNDVFLDYLESLEENTAPLSSEEVKNTEKRGYEEKNSENNGVCRLKLNNIQPKSQKNEKHTLESKYEDPSVILPKKEEKVPIRKEIESQNEIDIQKLLESSQTLYEEEWIEQYEKAQKSKKQNYIVDKIKNGKFRFNKKHQIEILPDADIYGKTSNEILSKNYD